jgi:hypothetical protein
MEQMLDRRNALKMGLLATVGFGALSRVADASTGLQSQNEAVVGRWFAPRSPTSISGAQDHCWPTATM